MIVSLHPYSPNYADSRRLRCREVGRIMDEAFRLRHEEQLDQSVRAVIVLIDLINLSDTILKSQDVTLLTYNGVKSGANQSI
jgi:hypothetical protein